MNPDEAVFSILTYKRTRSLLKLVQRIRSFDGLGAYKIFVWNNDASHDLNPLRLAKKKGDLILLNSKKNIKMQGKNSLEKHILQFYKKKSIKPRYYAQFDDDVMPANTWYLEAKKAMESDQRIGMLGSIQWVNDRPMLHGQTSLKFSRSLVGSDYLKLWDPYDEVWKPGLFGKKIFLPADFVGHRACLIRFSLLLKNMHDPYYRIGGEDLDYSLSLRKGGLKIGFGKNMFIYHRPAGESSAPNFRNLADFLAGWKHFLSKWGFIRSNTHRQVGLESQDWYSRVLHDQA